MPVNFKTKKKSNIAIIKKYSQNELLISAGIAPELKNKVHPNSKYGETIGDIALANHEGVPGHIPSRPFITAYITENKAYYQDKLKEIAQLVLEGKDPGNLAIQLAKEMEEGIKAKIWDKSYVANSPITIKKKGSDIPLVDSGVIIDAIIGWVEIK